MQRLATSSRVAYDPDYLELQNYYWLDNHHVMATCAFHDDQTPSMSVNVVEGVFYCFSCHESGRIEKLATATNGSLSRTRLPSKSLRFSNTNKGNEWLSFLNAPLAFDNEYLASRGVTNEQVDEFSVAKIENGIVFPVVDIYGTVTGALIRLINSANYNVRYIKLGDMQPLWPMSYLQESPLLDACPELMHNNKIDVGVLVEGVFGVLRGLRAGVPTFSISGTVVDNRLIATLHRFNNVLVAFDNDFPGYVAAGRIVKGVPHSHVIVPGQEWDEMPESEWEDMYENGWATTRNLSQLARISGDKTKFYSRVRLNNQIYAGV